MADVTITPSNVAVVSTATATVTPTVTARGIAGVVIKPGQAVYADQTAGNLIKLASAQQPRQANTTVGIAMGSADPNQPVTYAVGGDIAVGNVLISGLVYALSDTAGNIAPVTDTLSRYTVIGVGNGGATGGLTVPNLRLGLIPASINK